MSRRLLIVVTVALSFALLWVIKGSYPKGAHRAVLTESPVTGQVSNQVKEVHMPTATQELSEPALRALFEEAAACGDRYRCPSYDRLIDLAAQPRQRVVLMGALRLMRDRDNRASDRTGRVAFSVVQNWALSQARAGVLGSDEKAQLLQELAETVQSGAPSFRPGLYGLIGARGEYELPGASEFLLTEIERTDRSTEEIRHAAETLGPFQKDLSLVRRYINSPREQLWLAALAMLPHIDQRHSLSSAKSEEKGLLLQISNKSGLSAQLAALILDRVEIYGDRSLIEAARALLTHPDTDVANRARILVQSQQDH